jgi:pyruvate formate lyase activating enzyme
MEARYFQGEDGKIRCLLCPNRCLIAPGRHGICGVRTHEDGSLALPFYGKLSAVAVDPIEKKPLYHFYPGSTILSLGFVGCSFHCPFCQNFHISQDTGAAQRFYTPLDVVRLAQSERSFGIAYTYSEPLIHFEYVLETSRIAREEGLKNVLVTNGYLNPEPAEELLALTDAANVDLKSFRPEFYRKEIGGDLDEVKRFIAQASQRIHLEVTTLVIPQKNDTDEEIEAIARFLADLNPDIPYHLSCYYPAYRYSIPATDGAVVERLSRKAREHLNFVYLGNVGVKETPTRCPKCDRLLISRQGYQTKIHGLKSGKCPDCGRRILVQ